MKKHFKTELAMNKKDERNFRTANKCHICNKLYSVKDIRVKNHSAHQICNVNCRLT